MVNLKQAANKVGSQIEATKRYKPT